MAERDTALKQGNSSAQELSQLRESSAALQQQLHVMSLEKHAESEKAVKVTAVTWQDTSGIWLLVQTMLTKLQLPIMPS